MDTPRIQVQWINELKVFNTRLPPPFSETLAAHCREFSRWATYTIPSPSVVWNTTHNINWNTSLFFGVLFWCNTASSEGRPGNKSGGLLLICNTKDCTDPYSRIENKIWGEKLLSPNQCGWWAVCLTLTQFCHSLREDFFAGSSCDSDMGSSGTGAVLIFLVCYAFF